MKKLLLVAFAPFCLVGCGSQPAAIAPTPINLPAHTIKEAVLAPGSNRVEIASSDPQLSRSDCEALVNNYLDRAGKAGQVSVQKPNPKPPWNGKMLPFCVNNLDGKGTSFNDSFFQ